MQSLIPMAMDTHKMHGDILAVKDQLKELKIDLEFTYQKTSRNELEINKLKNRWCQVPIYAV